MNEADALQHLAQKERDGQVLTGEEKATLAELRQRDTLRAVKAMLVDLGLVKAEEPAPQPEPVPADPAAQPEAQA